MPQEVAKCFEGKPGAYGRYVIASGPYMIEGSDDLDISSCKTLKPISGYDGQTTLTLVRNPNYNARTDSRKARESNPDRFEFTVDTNIDDIYNKIAAGDLEDAYATASPKVFREYSTSASKRKYLHSNFADGTYYITMNLTQPPFDDVHVRTAMNWVMDREALRKAWGGAVSGVVAEHIIPTTMLDREAGQLPPVQDPGDRGSVAKASAEMAQVEVRELERCLHGEGVQERAADHRRPGRRQADAADRPGRRGEDRHHVHVARRQRRLPGDPDDVEERPDLEPAALVQGLRGPVDVHRPAVRRRAHHPER